MLISQYHLLGLKNQGGIFEEQTVKEGLTVTQKEKVLLHLKKEGSITPLEALLKYNVYRLSDVIFKLRGEGHNIETFIKKANGTKYAQYIYVLEG